MNLLDVFKKDEPLEDPFTKNRGKKVMATVLMPTSEEQKQAETEAPL